MVGHLGWAYRCLVENTGMGILDKETMSGGASDLLFWGDQVILCPWAGGEKIVGGEIKPKGILVPNFKKPSPVTNSGRCVYCLHHRRADEQDAGTGDPPSNLGSS